MSVLALALLGRPQIKLDDAPVEIVSQKAQALLYYLALTGQPYARQSLAGLLWSDLDEAAARRNLRVELLKLRNHVDEFIETARDTLAFDRTRKYMIDVTRFEACLRGHEPTFAELQEAVALYRGHFLEDFFLRDAPLFEEWMTSERERLWQLARQARLRLVEHYISRRLYTEGIACVTELLKQEPWLEEAHQQLMRLLARNGQRTAALAHYEVASKILYDEFGVPPSDETNALYDQIEQGEWEADVARPAAAETPAPTITAPPFQAPGTLLHFVGRAEELGRFQRQLVSKQANRPVALVGMAGVGKTTLVGHLAHDLRTHFADGVLWAYAANSEPLDILGSWASALGYDFSALADVENRAVALRGVLADKQILFVIDDGRSASRIRPLLVGGTRSATLITTRDLEVATALNAQPYLLAELSPADGEGLLARILGDERVNAELAAARQICTLLQNLPLAVEITAQRLLSRPRRRLSDIAERLENVDERLDLAVSDRAVRTSFMVSWESLDSNLRRIFALLGVFAGRSFQAEALAAIADLDLYIAEDRLFALTALSLLTEAESEGKGALRYRQHPLLADFACEQLGEDLAAQLHMAHYYLTFAQAHCTDYTALQPEWENLIAGLEMAHTLAEWRLVLDYAQTLTPPWFTRARYAEARQAYQLAKEAAEHLADEQALAACLLHWGRACVEQYDYAEAEKLLTAALALQQQLDNPNGVAGITYQLARIALEQAKYEQAETLLRESQQQVTSSGDAQALSVIVAQQALLAYRRGELAIAKQLCNQILQMETKADPLTARLPTLRLLADIALEEQRYEIAEVYCNQSLALCEQLDNRSELAAVYYSLTVVARCQMKLEAAQKFAQHAIEQCNLTGNRGFKALTLHELSRIYTNSGNYKAAIATSEESMDLLLAVQDSFNLVYILRQLGEAQIAAGETEKAHSAWTAALTLAESQQHPLTEQLRMKL